MNRRQCTESRKCGCQKEPRRLSATPPRLAREGSGGAVSVGTVRRSTPTKRRRGVPVALEWLNNPTDDGFFLVLGAKHQLILT